MFRHLCNENDARLLFQSNPLLISTLVEIGWAHRPASAFNASPEGLTRRIVGDFFPNLGRDQELEFISDFINRGYPVFDHLIYAYLIENTRILDIFCKVMEAYRAGEQLDTPSREM